MMIREKKLWEHLRDVMQEIKADGREKEFNISLLEAAGQTSFHASECSVFDKLLADEWNEDMREYLDSVWNDALADVSRANELSDQDQNDIYRRVVSLICEYSDYEIEEYLDSVRGRLYESENTEQESHYSYDAYGYLQEAGDVDDLW